MAMQALTSPDQHAHLLGDVPALIIVGIALIALAPPKPLARAVALAPAEAAGALPSRRLEIRD
jgi:hypothetical protein